MSDRIVKLISQTGNDLSAAEAEKLDIEIIPDIVRFGDEEFLNQVEITNEEFYRRLRVEKKLPSSSHPSVGDFMNYYKKAVDEGAKEILCVMVTSKMSGSYDTALAAKKMFERRNPDIKIVVYDSQEVSHGGAQLLRVAAQLADQGLGAEEIAENLEVIRNRVAVYFMLNTLEFARRGGRVGSIKAFAADALGIKALLKFEDGLCSDFAISKSYKDGLKKLIKLMLDEADPNYPITVFHGDAPETADMLMEEARKAFPEAELIKDYVGAVIGIYAGPGSVGFAYTRKESR